MAVSKQIEYTCDWCGQNGKSELSNYMPPDWISLAKTVGGKFASLMVGTWLYAPLTSHFCCGEHAKLWMEQHRVESKADET